MFATLARRGILVSLGTLFLAGWVRAEPQPAWRSAPPSALARTEVAGARLGSAIYVVGGYETGGTPSARVERYDLRRRRWSLRRSMPLALNHTAVVTYRGALYALGGYTGAPLALPFPTGGAAADTPAFLRYDPRHDSWTRLPDAPTSRAALAAAVIGHRLYAAGGREAAHGPLRRLDIYDFRTHRWSRGPDMGLAREHVAGTSTGGSFYVLGGRNVYGGTTYRTAERYLPGRRRWERLPDMTSPHAGFAAVAVAGRVVAFGGEQPGHGATGTTGATEALDPDGRRWTPLPTMAQPRHGLAGVAIGSRVYAIEGGPVTGASLSNTVETLDLGLGMRISAHPRRAAVHRRVVFHFRVTVGTDARRRPVAGATVILGRHRAPSDRQGRARMLVVLRRRGHLYHARVVRRGFVAGSVSIRAR